MLETGPRVLVVDDSAAAREVAQDILEMAGCSVVGAQSAEDALDLLSRCAVDVLVADIFLPGMNGVELIAETKARHLAGHIVAVSSGGIIAGRDALDAACLAGAETGLKKPFAANALINAVRGSMC